MQLKPVLLLADSQLLFRRKGDVNFLQLFLSDLKKGKAAYIGAANNDRPEFYQIFTSALSGFEALECRHVKQEFTEEDQRFLNEANLILLAGGDLHRGWQIMKETGMSQFIINRYYKGAYLIGVSAGAVHCGLAALNEQGDLLELLKCLPFVVDVHQDQENWERLKKTIETFNNPYVFGLGIPLGCGVIYHPDHSLELLNKPAFLFEMKEGNIQGQMLLPEKLKTEKQAGEP